MSTYINNKLVNFAQKELVLAYSANERAGIDASLTQLEKVLKDRFHGQIVEIKRFGSYTRNTILPRKYDSQSDVDLLIVFNTSSNMYTPGTYRTQLKNVISAAYPYSVTRKDFPTVKLELNHIMFDLVPAYRDTGFWGNPVYYIPDQYDGWRQTTPNDINQPLSEKNQAYGNNIVRNVIRLCKHWNASRNYVFASYELEKWIIERHFYYGDNLYEKFQNVLRDGAYNDPGTIRALDWIKEYQGTWNRQPDELKQLEWLRKLLPGFTY